MSSEKQVVVCEGCGSKWLIEVRKGCAAIIAKLVECPICEVAEAAWNAEM